MALPTVTVDLKWRSRTSRKYMQDGELEILLTLVDSVKPKSMIEFGVNEGITAFAVLMYIETIERYVGVDVPFDHQLEIPAQQIEVPAEPGRLVKSDPKFRLFLRTKEDDSDIDGLYDVAFIDGDHGYHAVMKDYNLAKRLVRQGGIIIFHDYGNPTVQVTPALDDLYFTGKDIKHVAGTWLAFERV